MSARLFIAPESLAPGTIRIEGKEHHYLARVRRIRAGDSLRVCDGAGREAPASVVSVERSSLVLELGEPRPAEAIPPLPIAVALAPVKGDRTEWAIQKLVELGVSALHPVETARSVVALKGRRAAARIERYRTIAAEAARQSQNPSVPRIEELRPLSEGLAALASADLKLALWEDAQHAPLGAQLPAHAPADVAMIVGPEGGLTANEVAEAEAAGFRAAGLGPRILRAETAAVAAVAVVQHVLGDLG